MRTLSIAVKPIVIAVSSAVALFGCLGGGGGGGDTAAGTTAGGAAVAGVLANSLVDKAPIRLICTKDGTVLGTGATTLGSFSVTIDPTKCAGQVLVELDTASVPAAGLAMAGPDNVFGTGDDEVYKPAERMPLKAMVDMTSAKVGDTVPANVSPITTAITNGALEAEGITTTNDLQTELAAKKPTDTAISARVTAATTSVATALGLTQTGANYTKIDPRTNTEVADKGGALAAAVFSATKAAGQTAQQIVSGIATNLNTAGNAAAAAGDITKLSGNAAVTSAITAAKPLIDAEAKARKDMVDAMQLMGVTNLPATKAALDTLLTAKKADATATVTGTATKVADVAAVFEARQKESVVIAAAQKYVQDSVVAGATAAVEMSKVVGVAVALVQKANDFVASTANTDATKQVAAQQDIMKNVMAVVAADVATMNTVPTTISTATAAQAVIDVSKIVTAAQQIVTAAVNSNVLSAFATPDTVAGGQPGTFDTATIIGVDKASIATSVGLTTTLQEFQPPPVAGSSGNVSLDAAKITDPGEIAFTTTTRSAVTDSDVIESDEITVANVNTQIPVKASGQGVSLVITNASGVKTVLDAGLSVPYETPVGYVIKGDKVKLSIKSPPVAQTPTKVSVTAALILLGKDNANKTIPATRTASMTVQGPAGVVPGMPTISDITVSDGSATITLTAPSSFGSAAITEYTVTATPVGGGTPITVTGTGTSITITGLTNGTAYTFSVSATNGVGTGAASSQSASHTPATAPAAPTSIVAAAGNGQATVTFTAPTSDGGAAITGYTVTATPASGPAVTATGTSSPITVTGLTNGTAYTFTVKATNGRGITSAASTPSNSVTPVGAAGAPTGVSAVAGNAHVVISFTAPANSGGATITGYIVTATPAGGGTPVTATGTASPISVTGLTNGTAYTFVVTATNTAGTGATSASVTATPATVPNAPTAVSAAAGDGQAVVSFTAPGNGGSAITGYTVTATPATGAAVTANGTTSPITVTGLTNGTAYTFTVVAINAKGSSAASSASASVTPAAAPGAPSGVTAVAGNGSASVSFAAPSNTGGAAITGYTVTSSPGGLTGSGTASPITVTGLTNGTAYTFTVRATSSAGAGPVSTASSAVTPATVPGAPTGVSAAAGNGAATVSFTAPTTTGGAAITGYTVTSSPGGFTGTGTASPITVNGLTNDTAYTFTVVAVNAKGSSTASSASGSVTPVAPPVIPALPTAATTFSASKQGFNTVVTFGPYSLSGVGSGAAVSVSTPTGLNASSAVSASVNSGAFGTTGAASDGDSITIRVTTGTGEWQAYVANLTVGSLSRSFAACTAILEATDPDFFTPAGTGTNSVKCPGTPSH